MLPRQVCGLYTHTIYKSKYPGGFDRLEASIRGGELFETILHNPVNIYMSHMSNYANDRLAPYTFGELFKFVQEHTNLRLMYAPSVAHRPGPEAQTLAPASRQAPNDDYQEDDLVQGQPLGPLRLANYYFELHPDEREPLWTNPCHDKRHLDIWAPKKHALCRLAPSILIVGPQKTGTTALHSFLKLNPAIKTSLPSPTDFEEVQFFNDKHYLRGPDWYFSRFLNPAATATSGSSQSADLFSEGGSAGLPSKPEERNGNEAGGGDEEAESADGEPSHYYLDKSATYFDDPKAPRRAAALLPDVHILLLLIDPADRAYSWYQHMRAHGDSVASELTFDELLDWQESPSISSRRRRRHDERSRPTASARSVNGTEMDSSRIEHLVGALRNRCLHPGYYSSHLSNWLQHFDSRQVVIIDGEWFKYNPVAVMNRLQLLLRLPGSPDYAKLLVRSESKGFYCERLVSSSSSSSSSRNQIKCLGSGKGRRYEPMSQAARAWLNNHYLGHNKQLAKLLYDIGQPLPTWLDRFMNRLPLDGALTSS